MGIALTDDHRELAEVARAFLTSQKARCGGALAAGCHRREPARRSGRTSSSSGWLGLHVDEEHGGSGYGLPELVVVIEELGRAVAPGPFVPTVIASAVIAKDGTAEQKSRLLPGLIDGTVTAGIGLDSQVQLKDGRGRRRRRRRGRAGRRAGRAAADRRRRRRAAAGPRPRRRVGRGAGQPRSDPALRAGPPGQRERQRRRHPGGRAGIGAGPRADVAGRRGGGRSIRLRRRRRRLRQGAPAVRPHHRHFPSGEAPLREHAGGRRVGDRRGVGCLARGGRGRGAVPPDRRGRRGAGVPGLRAQRRAEHSGARRHRLHLGARRASASAPRAGDRGAVRR